MANSFVEGAEIRLYDAAKRDKKKWMNLGRRINCYTPENHWLLFPTSRMHRLFPSWQEAKPPDQFIKENK